VFTVLGVLSSYSDKGCKLGDVHYRHGYGFEVVSLFWMYMTELQIRLCFRTFPHYMIECLFATPTRLVRRVGTPLCFVDSGPARLRCDLSDSFYQTIWQLNYPPTTRTHRSMWQEA
jgi:hypothetical protein